MSTTEHWGIGQLALLTSDCRFRRLSHSRAVTDGTGCRQDARESLMSIDLEEGPGLHLDFSKLDRVPQDHVLPCAVQDVLTGEVILVAYVNAMALERALETRSAVFWSTSRDELWEKGATSGETFELVEVRV